MENGILEMNAAPTPKWVNEFKKYLITKLNIDRITAIEIVGNLCRIKRLYKEPIDEEELQDNADMFEEQFDEPTWDDVAEAYKAGYYKAKGIKI